MPRPLPDPSVPRRTLLAAGGALAVGGALAACSSSSTAGGGAVTSTGGSTASVSTAPGVLTTVAAVPVGGGVIVDSADGKVVVTQPASGQIKAFSAVCTHQGCTVNQVADGTIDCPCHGSAFDASTGAVVRGPASAPLAAVPVMVKAGDVVLA